MLQSDSAKQLLRSPPNNHRLSEVLSVLLGFVLFGLSIWTISQEFRKYHPRKLW